jgi:hypothetical protein
MKQRGFPCPKCGSRAGVSVTVDLLNFVRSRSRKCENGHRFVTHERMIRFSGIGRPRKRKRIKVSTIQRKSYSI